MRGTVSGVAEKVRWARSFSAVEQNLALQDVWKDSSNPATIFEMLNVKKKKKSVGISNTKD